MKTRCPHCQTAVNAEAGRVECPRCGKKFDTNPELPDPGAFAFEDDKPIPPTLDPHEAEPEAVQTRPARRRRRQDDEDDDGAELPGKGSPMEWLVCLCLAGVIALMHLMAFVAADSAIQQAAASAAAAAWTITVYVIVRSVEKCRRPRQ